MGSADNITIEIGSLLRNSNKIKHAYDFLIDEHVINLIKESPSIKCNFYIREVCSDYYLFNSLLYVCDVDNQFEMIPYQNYTGIQAINAHIKFSNSIVVNIYSRISFFKGMIDELMDESVFITIDGDEVYFTSDDYKESDK
jgi:hypothetical protein